METLLRLVGEMMFYLAYGVFIHWLFYRIIFIPFLKGEWRGEWTDHGWRMKVYVVGVFYSLNLLLGIATYYVITEVAENVRILIDIYFLLT